MSMSNPIDYEAEDIYELNLEAYGLSHLKGRNIAALEDNELDALLTALGNDDISLNVPIPCTPEALFELVNSAECRKCGKCCQPNPLNPDSPGIEVFKEEITAIAEFLHIPETAINNQSQMGKWVPHPFGWTNLSSTRWLPQPCPFYNQETKQCTVHSVRPVVCRIHPVIFTGEINSVSIKLYCDYGKDLLKKALQTSVQNNPDFQMIL